MLALKSEMCINKPILIFGYGILTLVNFIQCGYQIKKKDVNRDFEKKQL